MCPLGVAVIGCGTIADFHIRAIQNIENAKLIGVSSRTKERAQQIGEQENCEWTTDYRKLLHHPKVELICLTTSSGSHAKIGLEVLKRGKHLLVEKPLAMNSSDANRLIQTAKEKDVILSVVSQRRFERQHEEVKKVLSEGAIGPLLYVEVTTPFFRTQEYYDSADWRGTIAEDGGALMNQGIHSIDLMLWMAGEVKTVYGKVATKTHEMEAEDLGVGLVTFKNGALGTIMASTSIQPGFEQTLHLYGEKGSFQLQGSQIVHWTVPGIPQPVLTNQEEGKQGTSSPTSISTIHHQRQIEQLIGAIQQSGKPAVTGEEGREAVRLIEAIYESSRLGKEMQL
ncbi:Gfo/Idh/MocA family oxidoreductase [Lederbergia sp. NSJ-179]|uniref:Gfo/Idh/MocA family protein n=1 Tax=Lederbergia sp. NSJ-179 TaxID=2931402 RepID=UPI001FD12ED7|nr:Gfo/Idh/MocA family oxidoreductase [Lederbergia sp. NSJ-179]MCJ7841215.1 Gfo/Idh/MocA family oxidoreductase [Lederbergia sp. NSJ-179]